MISWLNKQLNEKPGSAMLQPPSMLSSNKYSTSIKPPTSGNTFKPSTFSSIDQLNPGNNSMARGQASSSYERSPYRNPVHNMSSPSPMSTSSINSSTMSNTYNAPQNTNSATIDLSNNANGMKSSTSFAYQASTSVPTSRTVVGNENSSLTSNIGSQP
jgi:hypothetical protein